MRLTPFDVVVVPFPYSDMLAEKRRPALVVSTPESISSTGHIWLAMITSVDQEMFGDAVIGDLASAGLRVRSRVRASKLATVDVTRVLRRAGALESADRERAVAALTVCAAF